MVKSSLSEAELKRAKEIYEIAQGKEIGERKKYLGSLTEIERGYYKKEQNKELQRKFNRNPENVARYNMERKDNIQRLRTEQPEKMKQQNLNDVKAFREREKQIKIEIEAKLKKELEAKLKREAEEKARNEIIGDILGNIIDAIPKKVQQKKNKEAVAKHRTKKAQGQPVRKYKKRNEG